MARAVRLADLRYSRAERMRSDREYRDVVRKGERATTPHFTVYRDYRAELNTEGVGARRKIGISVGKRIGGSVRRNRLKRLLREFYRRNKDAFPEGTRTAIVAKKAPAEERLDAVSRELLDAMTRRWGNRGGPARCSHEDI